MFQRLTKLLPIFSVLLTSCSAGVQFNSADSNFTRIDGNSLGSDGQGRTEFNLSSCPDLPDSVSELLDTIECPLNPSQFLTSKSLGLAASQAFPNGTVHTVYFFARVSEESAFAYYGIRLDQRGRYGRTDCSCYSVRRVTTDQVREFAPHILAEP